MIIGAGGQTIVKIRRHTGTFYSKSRGSSLLDEGCSYIEVGFCRVEDVVVLLSAPVSDRVCMSVFEEHHNRYLVGNPENR